MTSWPLNSSGMNGIGGAGITLAIVDNSSGACSARATKSAMVRGVAGSHEHAADHLGQLVRGVVEPRHHPEVAAAATDRPEQVSVLRGVGHHGSHPKG